MQAIYNKLQLPIRFSFVSYFRLLEQWEHKGCYRDLKKKKKKVFVKLFYAAPVKKMSPPPIGNKDKRFKATFELCRKAAEDHKLDINVIGIAIKVINRVTKT